MTRVNVNARNLNGARTLITRNGASAAQTQPGALQSYLNPPHAPGTVVTRNGASAAQTQPGVLASYLASKGLSPSGDNAGQPAAPKTPPAPFLTPAQQQSLDNIVNSNTQSIINMDTAFGLQAADTQAKAGTGTKDAQGNWHLDNTGTIYQEMLHSRAAQNNTDIARGLGVSSIRDGDLADIETTASLRRESLLNALAITQAGNDRLRANLNGAITTAQGNSNSQAVQNAQDLPVTPDAIANPSGLPTLTRAGGSAAVTDTGALGAWLSSQGLQASGPNAGQPVVA